MTPMSWIGYVGLVALTVSWVPQTLETVRKGFCPVNPAFLALSAVGSSCLAAYAFATGDTVFSILNILTTAGALLNLYYAVFPRQRP